MKQKLHSPQGPEVRVLALSTRRTARERCPSRVIRPRPARGFVAMANATIPVRVIEEDQGGSGKRTGRYPVVSEEFGKLLIISV
jgi:hypothetical protein